MQTGSGPTSRVACGPSTDEDLGEIERHSDSIGGIGKEKAKEDATR